MSQTLTLMTPGSASTLDTRNTKYQTIKGKVHHDLLNRLNLDRLTQISREDAEPEIRGADQQHARSGGADHAAQHLERESLITTSSTSCSGSDRSRRC